MDSSEVLEDKDSGPEVQLNLPGSVLSRIEELMGGTEQFDNEEVLQQLRLYRDIRELNALRDDVHAVRAQLATQILADFKDALTGTPHTDCTERGGSRFDLYAFYVCSLLMTLFCWKEDISKEMTRKSGFDSRPEK
ncbi:jg10305 [Pararge aegeria aegeria]|uniref:Jg10305 protein n=1 Tax=Pararge aegeria aegeria TaxID=348720 RepID=A0A8S4RWJ3_9NEOP|nr:jg10305 [Pararge aegeria aegeria]